MSRAVMQQALEALRALSFTDSRITSAKEALSAALAGPENQSQSQADTKVNPAEREPKPIAWMCPDDPDRATAFAWRYGYCIDCGKPRIPLYTAPTPQPEQDTDCHAQGICQRSGYSIANTPRKPLSDEGIKAALVSTDPETKRLPPGFRDFARAIERAHGIGEQT